MFKRHQGSWELQTNPEENNRRAQTFWRRTLNNYTGVNYREEVAETIRRNQKSAQCQKPYERFLENTCPIEIYYFEDNVEEEDVEILISIRT
ncbi:hypothetical protein YSY43_07720 [Paenibacillus sp. YSY-4.3]